MTTTEAESAARARVDDLLERMSRVDLQVVVVAPPDAERVAARDRARAAAVAAGRAILFDEAAAAARETTLRAFARGGFSGTWAANDWSISVANANDRAAAAAAFEEAAMAAVVEDLVDEETLEVLRATVDELGRATGLPSPGSLSSLTARAGIATGGPIQVVAFIGVFVLAIYLWGLGGAAFGILPLGFGVVFVAWLARRGARTDA
jgi:hypothetical protein